MRNLIAATALVAGSIAPMFCWAAEPLDRLFFTPEQRRALDAGKYTNKQSAPVKSGPRSVSLDGIVTRSDAENTIWVNGKAYHNGSPEGVRMGTDVRTPETSSVRVPGKASAHVKVGQQLDLNSGRVQESFERPKGAQRDTGAAEAQARPETAPREPVPTTEPAAPTLSR